MSVEAQALLFGCLFILLGMMMKTDERPDES